MDARSRLLRKKIVEAMVAGGRGHLPAALSLVEMLRVLYDDILKFDPVNPKWPDRDRFILSKGHGCLALYAILAVKGFFPESELRTFCKATSILGGHPEPKVPGVEAATGSLGHGLPIGIGFALNAKYLGKSYRTFVVVGDGECDEGSVWEAALCASKHKLNNLTVMVDYNKQQSYDSVGLVLPLEPFAQKWRAFGFDTAEVDGHDVAALRSVLSGPHLAGRPRAIICHTVKGKGIAFLEGNLRWHHKSGMTEKEVSDLLAAVQG